MNLPRGIQQNVELKNFTSWQIGGLAEYYSLPSTEEEIKSHWTWALENKIPISVLGGGSNVLISDNGIPGLTLHMKSWAQTEVSEVEDKGQNFLQIRARSGTSKSEILKIFLKHRLEASLFMAGLPGDVGGGVVMNAGVAEDFKPREFGELVHEIQVLSPIITGEDSFQKNLQWQTKAFTHDQLQWKYRHSSGWQPGLVLDVVLRWPKKESPQILERVKEANRLRLSKQPLDKPSCGSVFINPPGHKAAQLIDRCGLKGLRQGDAQVSEKHANFIVNLGEARAEDVWELIQKVKKVVLEKTQVNLQTEVVRLGRWPQLNPGHGQG